MTRLWTLLVTTAASAAIAAPASAQAPKLDLSAPPRGCAPASPGEIVVCGESQEKYRIDRDVLQVIREQELAANPPRPPVQVADGDPCKVGPNGCPGEGALPLLAIAMKAAQLAVQVAKGEDWREPLRTRPDEYEQYLKSKAKRNKAKPSVGIGIGISDGP